MEVEKKHDWNPVQLTCFNNAKTQFVLALGSYFLPLSSQNGEFFPLIDENSEVFSKCHNQLIMSLTFSHDDKLLLTGSVCYSHLLF